MNFVTSDTPSSMPTQIALKKVGRFTYFKAVMLIAIPTVAEATSGPIELACASISGENIHRIAQSKAPNLPTNLLNSFRIKTIAINENTDAKILGTIKLS